ncbi:PREDICTED: neuroligin-4, X-linked-like [Branchiostoma belcheri]|uniref:Neuroligin-4, X-linked-like n=1 Tax=Branchiostoma belcheri TaxID=7741 RepID=A0A6P4YGD8_BRABE|nr:PREDICTED: neuroligin-4, X-linked-like [Branchiostoma belcheri]
MDSMWVTSAILTWILMTASADSNSGEVITTKYGSFRGRQVPKPKDRMRPVNKYLGIPYAKPPVGSLRFRPPQEPEAWDKDKVRDFTKFGPACPQIVTSGDTDLPSAVQTREAMRPFLETMDEDCLYLNIYSPVINGPPHDDRYPLAVLVFIHGGGYTSGTGNAYDGTVLASHGAVVVVTLNYRLGVLGFLSTGNEFASGNYGLLDQIAALDWISENIGHFGGDRNRITLIGFGSGAACVNLLALSPKAAGKFRRAIIQSGSALGTSALAEDSRHYATMLAEKLDCCRPDAAQTVQCLRDKPYQDLLLKNMTPPSSSYYPMFGPSVDGVVVPDQPRRLLEGDLFRSYDFMVGLSEEDGYKYIPSIAVIENGLSDDEYRDLISDFVNQVFPYRENEIQDAILFLYTNWGNDTNETRRAGVVRMLTEQQIAVPIVEVANLHSTKNTESSTYMYSYSYKAINTPNPKWVGAVHGDELPFVFGAPVAPRGIFQQLNFTKGESMMSVAMMTYWSNFAKTGDPQKPRPQTTTFLHERPNKFENMQWTQYSVDNCSRCQETYLYLGMKPRVVEGFRPQRIAFWIELVPKLLYPQEVPSSNYLYPPDDADELCQILDIGQAILTGGGLAVRRPDGWTKPSVGVSGSGTTCVSILPTSASPSQGPRNTVPGLTGEWRPESAGSNISSQDKGQNYSELSIVIAVGTSLLVVNVIVFAVCYNRGRARTKRLEEVETRERIRLKVTDMRDVLKAYEAAESCRSSPCQTLEIIALKDDRIENCAKFQEKGDAL